ncbi:MAG: carbohydrate kinase family protein [Chloroflexi bacterium]|nr:carbohydrate kinase family protein [Chloroflexota bacterium]
MQGHMDILVTGSIAYDYLMRFPGKFTDYLLPEHLENISLSFLVSEMTKHWGGVAANIAYNLALFGLRPKLFGTVGSDFGDYRNWLNQAGVDTSTIRQYDDQLTSSFFVNTDQDNNQIASFYGGAMERARELRLVDVHDGEPDLVIISPNDPQAMSSIAAECQERGLRFIYDPSQQVPRLAGAVLRRDLQGAYAMCVNAYEAEIICRKAELTLAELCAQVEILIVTQGARGCRVYHQGQEMSVPAYPTDAIVDPTGGGDAFRAGFFRCLIAGLSLRLAAQVGALTATYALESVGTQNHHFTVPAFLERYRQQFDDEGQLDQLLPE